MAFTRCIVSNNVLVLCWSWSCFHNCSGDICSHAPNPQVPRKCRSSNKHFDLVWWNLRSINLRLFTGFIIYLSTCFPTISLQCYAMNNILWRGVKNLLFFLIYFIFLLKCYLEVLKKPRKLEIGTQVVITIQLLNYLGFDSNILNQINK